MNLRHDGPPTTFIGAVLFLLAAVGCSLPAPRGALLLHPVPPVEEGYRLSKGGLIHEDSFSRVSVRPVDWRELEGCRVVTLRGGSTEVVPAAHIFIAVRFENLTADTLRFDPAASEAVTEQGSPLPFRGFGRSPFIYSGPAGKSPPIELPARPEMSDIPPGGTVEGLLVYGIPEETAATVALRMGLAGAGLPGKARRFIFEAFPGTMNEQR